MKKIIFSFVAVAALVLTSCGGSSNQPAASNDNAAETEAAVDNDEEAGLALLGAYEGVVEEIEKVESKEDLQAICQALGETLKELGEKYPNYNPDEETTKAINEASTAVGEAIGTVGVALGMSQDEINEMVKLISE